MIFPLVSCEDVNNASEQISFNDYLSTEFKDFVTSDSITLHYMLKNPSNYGIEDFKPTLGDIDLATLEQDEESISDELDGLKQFDYNSLTEDQKLTYDVIKGYLETEEKAKGFTYYQSVLSPTIGLQAQLPVTLAEYKFYTKKDVDDYIEILNLLKAYFEGIIGFEQAKSAKGLFMSDSAVDAIVSQCNDFIANPENNFLIKTFDSRLDGLSDLTEVEKNTYKNNNKKAVLEEVIPTYQNLVTELQKLKGSGENTGGLCNFERGKEYYEYLVASNTGSSQSPDELKDILDERIDSLFSEMHSLLTKSPDLLTTFGQEDYGLTEPSDILVALKERITSYYPEAPNATYNIKYVDPSLEKNLSPAFFMIPPIDDFENNTVYINKSQIDGLTLFPTLAHEGYPGHLYQTTYFNSTNPSPIRTVLNFGGYSEGWATYVELQSYELANFDNPDLVKLLQTYSEITLALPTRIDIGVNYEGWDIEDTKKYITDLGFDTTYADAIFTSVTQEPANYLKYYVGYLEFNATKGYAEKKLGDKFVLKDFNKILLDVGPAPFPVIRKQVDKYIKDKK
jgi:uncharacterized protein (DUF885 family)